MYALYWIKKNVHKWVFFCIFVQIVEKYKNKNVVQSKKHKLHKNVLQQDQLNESNSNITKKSTSVKI
jgi:hypothetical protein